MAFGILEDLKHYPDGNVPGTALLDDHTNLVSNETLSHLKKGTGRHSHVVLVPQPSDDPNDPLNWPKWRKELVFYILVFVAGLVGAQGPLVASGYSLLAEQWGVSVNQVAASNGALVIALGCIMIIQAPMGVKFGRRPVFLIGCLCLLLTNLWSAVSKNLDSFTWSRVFQGLGMAPFEALVVSSIGDMYFVHERGWRSAVWGFSILAGINVAPIANGYIITDLGYRVCFWIMTGLYALSFVLIFFFCPETAYNRASVYDTETGRPLGDVAAINEATAEFEKSSNGEGKAEIQHLEGAQPGIQQYPPKKTFVQELRPISSTYRGNISLIKAIIRPFPFFLSPAVWWAVLSYGLTTCWLVVLSICSSIIFGSPPYLFDAKATGLMSLGPLCASIPATLIAGPLCDFSATWCARRNGGRFEPEFRLFLLLPMLILEVFGFMGWSLMTKRQDISFWGPLMMYSAINAGQAIGSTAVITYLLDVHAKHTPEAISIVNLTKNLILFGFTRFSVNWIISMGIPDTMALLAGLTAICILSTVPMYVYGKRIRSWVARHEKLFLATEKLVK